MDYDTDKVDKTVIALLLLTLHVNNFGFRAWKGHDWSALDRLHQKGMIGGPKSKAKSVVLTDGGCIKAAESVRELFGKSD